MPQLIAVLQSWIDELGIKYVVTDQSAYIFIAASTFIFLGLLALIFRSGSEEEKAIVEDKSTTEPVKEITKESKTEEAKEEVISDAPVEEASKEAIQEVKPEPKVEAPKEPTISWAQRLKKGLSRSNSEVWGKIGSLFSKGIDEDTLEEVEEILYGADVGPSVASEIIEALEEKVKDSSFNEDQFKIFLKDFLKNKMVEVQSNQDEDLFNFKEENRGKLKVIMIVGVNGAGKTTTIGKLATKLTSQGANVVVGACDTFRAAAVDQLQVWCERAGAKMIRAKEGANPSGVGYDALQTAMSENADYCILDTAGRLHTAGNLMDELSKSKNVLKKLMPEAPHQTLLVIDAITGQNAIRQAEEFNKALDLSGLIFTKCDGSSKAGSAVSIVQSLQVPITYIGVGENVEDLNVFDLDQYLDAMLDM